MAIFGEPANYIVFHPDNQRWHLSTCATAVVKGRRVYSWVGKVWVDRPPDNEDPFVLGSSWAYSYCHATQLRREPRPHGGSVTTGSCILFCSGNLGDKGLLAVDTVFWISKTHQWISPSEPPSQYSRDVANRTDIWKFHLRFGGQRDGHKGKYTYEAALYPQPDGRYSRLPLNAIGERVQVRLTDFPKDLRNRIAQKLHERKGPVPLSGADLRLILKLVERQTATAVVGNIVQNDDTFTALRRETGTRCHPRHPKRKGICC